MDLHRKQSIFLYAGAFFAVTLLVVLLYANTIPNPFIWDDDGLVVSNVFIRTWQNWLRVFASDLYSGTLSGSNFYRPVQMLSFMLDYRLWHLSAAGYHLTNILLHSLSSFFVFVFLLVVSGRKRVSLLAALLFAACPLHVESVAYISGRAETLMAVLVIPAFLMFVRSEHSRGAGRWGYYVLSLVLFIAALMAKELSGVLPLVITAWVFCFCRENFKKKWFTLTRIFPFFLVVLAYGIMRFTVLKFSTLWEPDLAQYPFSLRLMMLPHVMVEYSKMLLVPAHLHMSRTMYRPVSPGGIALSWTMLAALIFLAAAVFYRLRGRKAPLFLLVWSGVFFLPQSGLFPINAFVAEHFIYLASVSFFYALACLFVSLPHRTARIMVIAGILCLYGVLTAGRNYEWRNPVAFYQGIVNHSPDSYLARNNLGVQYSRRGDYTKAAEAFAAAIRIKPYRIEARSNLASTYYKMKRFDESLAEYFLIEKMVPANRMMYKAGEIQNNIGNVYMEQEAWERALERYDLALKIDPGLRYAHFNKAYVYRRLGEFDKAAQEACASFPHLPADSRAQQRVREIIAAYVSDPQVSLRPISFYNDLGIRFAQEELWAMAVESFSCALGVDLLAPVTRCNLGLAFLKWGERVKAAEVFREITKLFPDHTRAAALLRELRRP